MRKIIVALCAIGTLFFPFASSAEELIIASEGGYPPFNYVDSNNKLIGFDLDIGEAICQKMQVTCKVVAQDWDGLIPGLLANKFDAVIASMAPTPERQKIVDFTNRYYTTTLAVAVPKSSTIKDLSPQAFKGKKIGAQAGTAQAMYAEDKYVPAGAILKVYPTAVEANSDFKDGRLDAVIQDKFPLVDWLKHDGSACCKLLGEEEGTSQPIAIAIRKNSSQLKERINKALDEIRADGTYKKLEEKYSLGDIY